MPVPGFSGSNAPKFQLGETLPVVPARTVRRILRGKFVDMAELSEEHLEFELRRSLEGEEGKPLPASKLRPVPDLLSWAKAFCHFAGIVVPAHPDKAVDLWAYLAIMLPITVSLMRNDIFTEDNLLVISHEDVIGVCTG